MTLALVIALVLAWLLAGVICVALCVTAARGDRGQMRRRIVLARGSRRFRREFESAV